MNPFIFSLSNPKIHIDDIDGQTPHSYLSLMVEEIWFVI